jgi:hypothetical protein
LATDLEDLSTQGVVMPGTCRSCAAKMHLVLAPVFAGLCSHAAFAVSEGGDTW